MMVTIQPISTKRTISSKQRRSQFHQYQQNTQSSLNNDGHNSEPIFTKRTITSKQWWSIIQPISTKSTITSKQWWSQFNQYQQRVQSPLNIDGHNITNINKLNNHISSLLTEHWTHEILEIQILAWDRHTNVAGVNRLMGSNPSPLDNWKLLPCF